MPNRDEYDDPRRDDGYDDRRRDDGYDDHQHDDYDDGGGATPRERLVRRAKQRVNLPAIFLIILGLLSLVVAVAIMALVWIAPDVIMRDQYEMMKQFMQGQQMPAYEDWVQQQRVTTTVINALRVVMSILMTIGAMKMRSLEGYGLAMASSIIAMIPLCPNECCCAFPFGLWAIIVLVNADVKRAFSIVASGGASS